MRRTWIAITAVILAAGGCTVQAQPKTDQEPANPPGEEFLQPGLPHAISRTGPAAPKTIAGRSFAASTAADCPIE